VEENQILSVNQEILENQNNIVSHHARENHKRGSEPLKVRKPMCRSEPQTIRKTKVKSEPKYLENQNSIVNHVHPENRRNECVK